MIFFLISSKLDYFNSLNTWFNQQRLQKLQLVQNREHVTLILASSHWLPINFIIDFMISLLTFKAHSEITPKYSSDCLTL